MQGKLIKKHSVDYCGRNDDNNNLDYVHTVSFSLGFYIVLRPQGIRKQMKTLRKRHRMHVHIAIELSVIIMLVQGLN